MLTAYIRVLGGALGTPQYFTGPMAKQHRMFVITLGALLAAFQTSSFTGQELVDGVVPSRLGDGTGADRHRRSVRR